MRDAISRGLPTEDITWTYVRIGVTYFNRGDYDLAQKNYQAALNLAPNSYLALEHLAELRAAQAKGDEALHLYARVLELSQAPEFYEAIGAIYEERGDDISADRFYSQAEQTAIRHLDAGDIGFYRYLAAFYSDVRPNVTKAVHFAQADLAVRQDAHTYATLAWALYRAYDFQSSVSAVKKALVVPSQDSAMLCRASKIYRAVGDAERAEQLVSEALRANKMISDSVCRGDLADRGSASS